MDAKDLRRIPTISEFHRSRGLPPPEHPLINVVDYADIRHSTDNNRRRWALDFYSISVKGGEYTRFTYGHQAGDFEGGSFFCMAPGQVYGVEIGPDYQPATAGWLLLVHPDFLWGTVLAKSIRQYNFFEYGVNEALFLSPREEATVNRTVDLIRQEYTGNIDKYSKRIICSHLENLLSYAERFYHRQFTTRHKANHEILVRLETLLTDYFANDDLGSRGLPSVQYVAEELHVSASYLGSMLRVHTGQSTQQHIHDHLIAKAKVRLSTTNLSVSEIAYTLGFEHSQSFSKLFRTKTGQSPSTFRAAFN